MCASVAWYRLRIRKLPSTDAGSLRDRGLTRVETLHPQRQPRLGDGNELESDVELAPPEVAQPSGSA